MNEAQSTLGRRALATMMIGTARDFGALLRQERRGGWRESATKVATFELGQNSLFALLPWKDEVPMKRGKTIQRKVHKAASCGERASIATVFGCTNKQTTGCFRGAAVCGL